MDSKLMLLLPTKEHIEELKQKDVNLETELARIVHDNLVLIKQGQSAKRVCFEVTKEQLDNLSQYGIDGPTYMAIEVKKEMHTILYKK
jgi:hypothetical protein